MESWVVVGAAAVYVALEAGEIIVLAARYRQLLKDEGRTEGVAVGRREQQHRWEAWARESQLAREEGREPPPPPELD